MGMQRKGWGVAVVDRDTAAFELLSVATKRSDVIGDAFSSHALEVAGISAARVVIATTEDDDRNVLIASVARRFGVHRTIARIRDPGAGGLERLGIETVCPTLLESKVILEHLALRDSATKAKRLRVVIAGAGRLGSLLATELEREGRELLVIDRSAAALEQLRMSGFGGPVLEGDAAQPSTLRRAAVAEAAVVVAIQDDRESLMISLVARRLAGAKAVLTRVSDPERATMYPELDLTGVCPTALAGEAILALVDSERVRGMFAE